jgi:hypothetical protein
LVAALPIIADALGQGSVNWADLGRAALAAGATALLALIKDGKTYGKTYGDPQLTSHA